MMVFLRRLAVLSIVSAPLALLGCGGEGTTVDAGKSDAPPVTNAADAAKDVNSQQGAMNPGSIDKTKSADAAAKK